MKIGLFNPEIFDGRGKQKFPTPQGGPQPQLQMEL